MRNHSGVEHFSHRADKTVVPAKLSAWVADNARHQIVQPGIDHPLQEIGCVLLKSAPRKELIHATVLRDERAPRFFDKRLSDKLAERIAGVRDAQMSFLVSQKP